MLKGHLETENELITFSYLFSTKDRAQLEMYFKLKNKYDHELSSDELNDLIQAVKAFGEYDVVIHPETTGLHLTELAFSISDQVVVIAKNNKSYIKKQVLEQPMMKAEKASIIKTIDEMGQSFQINKVKGNQRKRFKDILFMPVNLDSLKDKRVLLLDDSVFSGETLIALKEHLNLKCDVAVLFSKL